MTTRTGDEIRTEVAKAYGSRVQRILTESETVPLAQANDCCSTSSAETSCCGDTTPDEVQLTNIAKLYADADTTDLPSTVTDVAFGCGNPTAIAALKPGQVVLDLGSGGGIDCFLAAKMVGETGKVFGVDMTPEMIALARKNAAKVGATNVEFRLGEIERLPIDASSVDVIISNCVINLSPIRTRSSARRFGCSSPAAPPGFGHRLDAAGPGRSEGRHGEVGRVHRGRAPRKRLPGQDPGCGVRRCNFASNRVPGRQGHRLGGGGRREAHRSRVCARQNLLLAHLPRE